MKHLIHTTNGVGAIIDVPAGLSSDDYGVVQADFAAKHETSKRDWGKYAEMVALHEHDRVAHGVYYDWGLAGPGGAWFTLIRTPDITVEQLKAAEAEIRRNRDVVRLNWLRLRKMIDYSHPLLESTPTATPNPTR